MAGLSASGLITQIRSYTEVDSTVLSDSVVENIILNAQYRIFRDIPIDADRKTSTGNFTAGTGSVTVPAGAVFIRAVQVYTATGSTYTGANTYLERKDLTFFRRIYFSNYIYWNTKILCYVRYRSNWRKLIKLWIYCCVTNTKWNICIQNTLQCSPNIIRK